MMRGWGGVFTILLQFILSINSIVLASEVGNTHDGNTVPNQELSRLGYANSVLPGAEPRGIPNLPFIVDSNRYSDGVSWESPFSSVSPSFPVYSGEEVDPVWRKTRQLVELTTAESGVGSHDFTVLASEFWNPSTVKIGQSGVYSINVTGDQFWVDSLILIDAEGYSSYYDAVSKCQVAVGQCRSYLEQVRRLPRQNWMRLVCGIGDFTWKLQVVSEDEDRFMPLHEEDFMASAFAVGKGRVFTAPRSGELVCFANDAEGLYWNNQGNLTVTVSVVQDAPETLIVMR